MPMLLSSELSYLIASGPRQNLLRDVRGKTGTAPAIKQRARIVRVLRQLRCAVTAQGRNKMVTVDRRQRCPVDPESLPQNAEYNGTETVVVQDVIFRRDNVAFEREKYPSPSLGKVIYGPLPPDYKGYRFGQGVRSLVLVLYYATETSEP